MYFTVSHAQKLMRVKLLLKAQKPAYYHRWCYGFGCFFYYIKII